MHIPTLSNFLLIAALVMVGARLGWMLMGWWLLRNTVVTIHVEAGGGKHFRPGNTMMISQDRRMVRLKVLTVKDDTITARLIDYKE